MEIQGRAALVTGGASGLGAATTRELVSCGAKVAILDLASSDGEKVAAELPGGAIFCAMDVRNSGTIESALDTAVERFGGVPQVRQRVLVQQGQAWVVEGPTVVLGQVLAAEVHDLAVQVDHDHVGRRAVPEHLAGGRALAAAGDEHAARAGVREHDRLHEALVVHPLVGLGGLGLAVEHERAAEGSGIEHLDVLVGRVALEEHAAHAECGQ